MRTSSWTSCLGPFGRVLCGDDVGQAARALLGMSYADVIYDKLRWPFGRVLLGHEVGQAAMAIRAFFSGHVSGTSCPVFCLPCVSVIWGIWGKLPWRGCMLTYHR